MAALINPVNREINGKKRKRVGIFLCKYFLRLILMVERGISDKLDK